MIISGVLITNDNIEMVDLIPTGLYYLEPPRINTAQRNAMISTWELAEMGRMWFNVDSISWELWDGTSIVLMG